MADRARCPKCDERVSPYAAGCAVCGADLDTGRWDAGPSIGNRISSLWNAVSIGGYGLGALGLVLLGFFIVFFVL